MGLKTHRNQPTKRSGGTGKSAPAAGSDSRQNAHAPSNAPLPLPTLLSHLLVALTIEFDNEFEHRSPHRTSMGPVGVGGPWLASMVMYTNLLRQVPDEGIAVAELIRQSRTPRLQLAGMQRWGYVDVTQGPSGARWKGSGPLKKHWLVRPTFRGRAAKQVWAGLGSEIEQRWSE